MKYLTATIITINVLGLLLVQVLEARRPGSVAALVSFGWLITIALGTTAAAMTLSRHRPADTSTT